MDLSRSEAVANRLHWRESVDSTNTELSRLVALEDAALWPDFSVIATDNQTAGKGRLGRQWETPPGGALAVSVLLRPQTPAGRPLPQDSLGWLGLLAGLAMSRTCNQLLPSDRSAQVKWPNDVLIRNHKVCGVLSELVATPAGPAVIIGAGLNLTLEKSQLPVDTATSLLLEGVNSSQLDVDSVLSGYLRELSRVTNVFISAAGNMRSTGLYDQVVDHCVTIGQRVQLQLPSGQNPVGTAIGLNENGSLIVELGNCAEPLVVSAGDVTHVRAQQQE